APVHTQAIPYEIRWDHARWPWFGFPSSHTTRAFPWAGWRTRGPLPAAFLIAASPACVGHFPACRTVVANRLPSEFPDQGRSGTNGAVCSPGVFSSLEGSVRQRILPGSESMLV